MQLSTMYAHVSQTNMDKLMHLYTVFNANLYFGAWVDQIMLPGYQLVVMQLPYGGKLWRGKTMANLANHL